MIERYAALAYPNSYALRFGSVCGPSPNIRTELLLNSLVLSAEGRRIVGYGASAKGNTLLNRCPLPLAYIADDNPLKHGYLTPGLNVPIRPTSTLAEEPAELCLVLLAWNFAEEILANVRRLRPGRADTAVFYDAVGRQVRVQNALSKITTSVYDAAGRTVASINPLSQRTSFFYDAADQRISVRDANTNSTTILYDAVGRAQAIIDARNYRTSSVFDAAGRRIALIDGNSRRTSFAFDNADRLTVTKDPLLRRTSQVYDAAGRPTVRIDASSNRITSTYDAADRLIVQRYASRRNTLAYDAVGNRTRLADATGVYTTVFDAKNRVTRTSNADGKRVTYTLDALDRRTRLINPDAGRTTSSYDANDRLIVLINPQAKRTSFLYDAVDRRVSQKHGNSSRTTHLYDDAGQLTGIINAKSSGTLVNRFTYSYDNAGNQTVVKESSGDRTSFSYDRDYQLTRERKSGAVTYDVTYSYDPVGNRLVQIDGATRTTCAYDAANQILTEQVGANRTTYTHDNCGNRTRKDAPAALTVYRWDEDNKPTSIHPPSNALTLTYNADGKRIRKVNPTTTLKFIYDWEKVLQETDGADVTTQGYTSTNEQYGELVSAYDGTNTSYFQDDALGSTDALLDDSETVTDRYRYRAFGLDSHYQGATTNPYTFVGQQGYYRDSEIELYSVGARYYDYALGRWMSQDPLSVDAGDSNLYRYVNNNPITSTDETGLFRRRRIVITQPCQPPDTGGIPIPSMPYADDVITSISKYPPPMTAVKISMATLQEPNAKLPVVVWETKWSIKDKTKCGFIVQKVVTEYSGAPKTEYWEAWEVVNGVIYLGYKKTPQVVKGKIVNHKLQGGHDYFIVQPEKLETGEFIRFTGYTKFYEDLKIDWKLGIDGGVPQSVLLPSTDDPPGWWDDKGSVMKRFELKMTARFLLIPGGLKVTFGPKTI